MSSHFTLRQKNWGCPKKLHAREETIIAQYRSFFNRDSLPDGLQYWTMCGQCSNDGALVTGCELDHLTKAGLVTPDQFHGVELAKDIDSENQKLSVGHFYGGDFYRVMSTTTGFNPGIVNCDTISFPERAAEYASDIMALLSEYPQEIMLVVNVMLEHHQYNRQADKQQFIDTLVATSGFMCASRKANWTILPECFCYSGTGKSSTVMGTYILIKHKAQ